MLQWVNFKKLRIPRADDAQKNHIARLVEYLHYLNGRVTLHSSSAGPRDFLMRDYFEQIVNGLVYELYFPEDLHAAGLNLFDLVEKANLPALEDMAEAERLSRLRALFEMLYDSHHPLRGALFHLGSLEVVRTIEGQVKP
jgi:hypothetical protein